MLQLVSRIKEEPQLIIIASEQHNLRANLSLLPSTRYPNTPIICFNQIENLKLLRPLFGTNFCKAYFNGYLYLSGATLSLCGPEPKITLSVTEKNNQPHPSQELLTGLGFSCTCQGNDTLNFWQNNAEPIIGYLASRPKQHIAELLKADDTQTDLMQAIKEIITLAKHEKVKLSAENIIRRFLETPKGFYYKNNEISKTETAFILDRLYNTLSQKSHLYKCKISKINQLGGRKFERILQEQGIDAFNGAQGRILYVLWQRDGMRATEIAKESGLAKTTLTSMLSRMREQGLVSFSENEGDGRSFLVFLTPQATALREAYENVSRRMGAIYYSGFSAQEVELFEGFLVRILTNLEENK